MAFASRIGNALRKTSALLQAVRCMSSSKLFVAGLSYATDESSLKNAFSHYGTVLDARVIVDRDSGRSRGFGFVTYSTCEDAAAAVTAMDGKDLQGRTLKVNYANDRAGGIRGGAGSGGYATNNASSTNYDSASGGRYGISGSYDIAGNSDGSTGGYNSPTTYGAGKHSPGAAGSGTFGELILLWLQKWRFWFCWPQQWQQLHWKRNRRQLQPPKDFQAARLWALGLTRCSTMPKTTCWVKTSLTIRKLLGTYKCSYLHHLVCCVSCCIITDAKLERIKTSIGLGCRVDTAQVLCGIFQTYTSTFSPQWFGLYMRCFQLSAMVGFTCYFDKA